MKLLDFGFRKGINEVIAVTYGVSDIKTHDTDGLRNTAPIGIIVEDENSIYAKVKLYDNHTRKNVESGSRIYTNICFNPIIFAVSAFEDLDDGSFVSDNTLKDCYSMCVFEKCRAFNSNFEKAKVYELRLVDGKIIDYKAVRAFNRGFAAVVECAVHATRYIESKSDYLKNEILRLGKIIEKCGGDREQEAYKYLLNRAGIS